ncbi:GNAT family N-acetyltransferase [Micromonospora sp. WMMD1102]|uniref:GNAT family N-acetyltransferase n=1 Tax=Micromonospora sp. WMMD1102 TaxID=3016105 RepID=UPI002414D794|nr:GNAT family N-acetyltransferase [Micromonospora sp. WMMD1102]MDG4787927.1 GNAT family N-acetyltransferase [Micromonospora sp. WMMD1102]
MPSPEITIATPADRTRVVSSLVAAFSRDSVLRYLFPDEDTYPQSAAAFFGHLFDRRVAKGTIWTIERGASTALWEPPPTGDHDSSDDDLAAALAPDALARVRGYARTLHAALPAAPFWYLGVLGTHPDSAGRGWGRAVMAAGLRRAAADGLPAVLETSNPVNVEVYRRAGWEVVRSVTEPLPTWIMQQQRPSG